MYSLRRRTAFTLTELLIVIGIIVLLISILIPVVSRVRTSAQVAGTRNFLNQLVAACERYYNDQRAYPGPIPNANVRDTAFVRPTFSTAPIPVNNAAVAAAFNLTLDTTRITGAENLVLGLCGGLRYDTSTPNSNGVVYNPSTVGQGAGNLTANNYKSIAPYMEATNLSWRDDGGLKTGRYIDGAGNADDTIIPEFVDSNFSSPMPILYLRARSNATRDASTTASSVNNGIVNPVGSKDTRQAYDLDQIIGYTSDAAASGRFIGEGKDLSASSYSVSTEWPGHGLRTQGSLPPFLTNSPDLVGADAWYNIASARVPREAMSSMFITLSPVGANSWRVSPRNKDKFLLISAGADRVYGTQDDIVNFGN
jgi:type II secretory pathway pseudopilin PulG